MRTRIVSVLTLFFLLAVGMGHLPAQAPDPDQNPEGDNGALKAQVATGGSYDAHSGNGTRIVNDLKVPGALGKYGLDFTRYWNSVHPEDTEQAAVWSMDFGHSGWSHSWQWSAIYDEEYPDTALPPPHVYVSSITITFPDGHATKFKISRGDLPGRCGPPYDQGPWETNWPSPGPKVHDHLAEMAENGSEFWLYRADGGSVRFTGGPSEYQATEIYDPYGFKTELTYDGPLLTRVKQEGDRWLDIGWKTYCDNPNPQSCQTVIGKVETGGDAGYQVVNYKYSRVPGAIVLSSVSYANIPAAGQTSSAIYAYGFSYQGDQPGVGPQSGEPLLKYADDPNYSGAMTKIRYDYRGEPCPTQVLPTPPPNRDLHKFTPEAIKRERGGETGEVVSTFETFCGEGPRKDYNGIAGERRLHYGSSENDPLLLGYSSYQLSKITDFGPVGGDPSALPARRGGGTEPPHMWDALLHRTDFTYDSGHVAQVTHYEDGSSVSYDRINQGPSANPDGRIRNTYHHWLFKKTDENGNVTVYRRNERRLVTDITYYDALNNPRASEGYTYNDLNQVETHTLPSGVVQHYDYDEHHRLWREWNDLDGEADYTYYQYDTLGRVALVQNALARNRGKAFSAQMEYNGRHQVVKVTYPATDSGNPPFITYQYDRYGNCTAIIDELGHRKDYTYDAYRRCTSLTEQVNSSGTGCPGVGSRRWDWGYDRVIGWGGTTPDSSYLPSAHTSKEWRVQVEPAFDSNGRRPLTGRKFDCNNRMIEEVTGLYEDSNGGWHQGDDAEVHSFAYDENGQKKSFIDPRLRKTTYEYDGRNRLWKTNETVNTSMPRTTETLYDVAGNKTLVKFPDQKTQRWENYDAFGQPGRFFDERDNPADLIYCWGPMKKLYKVITHRGKDGGGMEDQWTEFGYDLMGRPKQTIFPDGSDEFTTYKFGQIETFKTRRGATKTISYDARGRDSAHTWDDGMTSGMTRVWDDANRLMSVTNNIAAIDYQYDSAGQVQVEGSTIQGSAGNINGVRKQMSYCRYPSGRVSQIIYPNVATVVSPIYTARGQLKDVGWQAGATSYVYWPDGKVNYQGFTGSGGVATVYGYNERGMISSVLHKNAHDESLAFREYWRDERDRIVAWKRGPSGGPNGMEDGRGDRYKYDPEGQLERAWYRAQNPQTENPVDPKRGDEFQYDELGNRKGSNRVATRGTVNFTRENNGLNQYESWYAPAKYDDDMGGQWGGAPHRANGVMMMEGYISASFNALNQPMGIWSPAYGSANYMWFGFDPLGRCVKRWVAPMVGSPPYQQAPPVNTNPAMYYYYDGWNLVQEGSTGNVADRVYVHGGRVDEIVASAVGSEWRYHLYDARGHCIMLTDPSGTIREQYDYDAFGYPYFLTGTGSKLTTSPWGNRFLFTGREWLKDLKVYDYRNRIYQPELGRFLQPDPKQFEAGDYNLYRYCHNDPVNKSDPTGLEIVVDPTIPIFYQLVLHAAIMQTAQTESGGRAISQLSASKNVHFYTLQTNRQDPRSEITKPNNLDAATNQRFDRDGVGSGSTIKIEPYDTGHLSDTGASQVGHATGHAQDIDSGTAVKGNDQGTRRESDYYSHDNEKTALKIELEVKALDEADGP